MVQPAKVNPIVIKKYANRRLYNTDTSTYVTLDDLCSMIKKGEEVIVYDAKNGDDITRSVLTQIIVEQEAKGGQNLLPTNFLRQLISFYGNNMQGFVPRYLEYSMQNLTQNQSKMADYFRTAFGQTGFGSMFPIGQVEEMSKQNMALFEKAMQMFAPFTAAMQQQASSAETNTRPAPPPPTSSKETLHLRSVPDADDDPSIKQMEQRLDDLQKQIAALKDKE